MEPQGPNRQLGDITAAPSKCCFPPPLMVIAGGWFRRFRFSYPISAEVACTLQQLPPYGIAGRIQTSKNDANPPPARSRGEAGSCQPFPQVFASGQYRRHIRSTRVAARFSARTQPGRKRGAGSAWRGWVPPLRFWLRMSRHSQGGSCEELQPLLALRSHEGCEPLGRESSSHGCNGKAHEAKGQLRACSPPTFFPFISFLFVSVNINTV